MSNLVLPQKPMLTVSEGNQAKVLFNAIKDNQRKLDECPKHHFPVWPKVLDMKTKFHCDKCNGYMDAIHTYSYCKGYQAHGGDPVDIIPEWHGTFGKEKQENSIVKGDHFETAGQAS